MLTRVAKLTLPLQKALLALQVVQFTYISLSYFTSTFENKFPVLESLFKPELAAVCTSTGCWQSMVPFPASLYCSILLLCIFAFLFRPGKELRLMFIFLASTQIFMGIVRVMVVPAQFYPEGVAMQASVSQFLMGALLLLASFLPYPEQISYSK